MNAAGTQLVGGRGANSNPRTSQTAEHPILSLSRGGRI